VGVRIAVTAKLMTRDDSAAYVPKLWPAITKVHTEPLGAAANNEIPQANAAAHPATSAQRWNHFVKSPRKLREGFG